MDDLEKSLKEYQKFIKEHKTLQKRLKEMQSKYQNARTRIKKLEQELEKKHTDNPSEIAAIRTEYDKLLAENNRLKRYERKVDEIRTILRRR